MPKTAKNYARRTAKYFNFWRKFFQAVVCKFWYGIQFRLMYRIEIEGKENIPKDNKYIVCSNHLSTLDPFLVCFLLNRPVAYMAKKELFEKKFVRWMLDWEGAFAVNREKLEIATIKTALEVNKTNWVLGLFPQGTRAQAGTIEDIRKGFAGLARTTKCNILPIGIVGSENKTLCPFKGKIKVKIGELIPFNEDLDKVIEEWGLAIQKLTGFDYIPTPTIA
ncbi:1-acyl-sn-glycerol-3-phosphate acyltransferase [bacterium]|nr:1-acyl-sn-glycerol-3-phosphate acyltransferase [bacterium]